MRSIAIGDNAMVTNCNPLRSVGGIAIGHEAIASNNYAMAIGYRAFANDTNSTVIAVGTNTVNSHGINTFTVGLTDNDPLNYFYLGSSSLKSLLDDNYANASQLDSIKGATNITTYVYGEGDDTVYELSLGGVGMIATHPSTDQAQAKFQSIELNSIVSDASYNNQSNCIAFCAKGVFDNPTPDFSKVSSLFVDGTRVPTEKYCDSRYVKKTDYNSLTNSQSVVIGQGAKGFAAMSVAIGRLASATNICATAIGDAATAREAASTAVGNQTIAAYRGTSIGIGATSTTNSVALGSGARATHDNSITIGYNAASHGDNTFNINTDSLDKFYLGNNKLSDLINASITNLIQRLEAAEAKIAELQNK